MVYVALSRVTNKDRLYIISEDEDKMFYHGKENLACIPLQREFERLRKHQIKTIDNQFIELLQANIGISIYTLNCQSLRAHSIDLIDKVIQRCDILVLSETRLDNTEHIEIKNFVRIIQFKIEISRYSGGVAIYRNINSMNSIYEPLINLCNLQEKLAENFIPKVGDMCGTLCRLENNFCFILISIYIYPNQGIQNIINYIEFSLVEYKASHNKLPLVIGGDFNVNFQKDSSIKLVDYLFNVFDLKMSNSPNEFTTIQNTTIDAVFSRHIPHILSKMYISYFSHHQPIISFFPFYHDVENNNVDRSSNLVNDDFVNSNSQHSDTIPFGSPRNDVSTEHHNNVKIPKPYGLPNSDGVSCYANASIIAIFNCPVVSEFFKNEGSLNILSEFHKLYRSGAFIDIKMIRSLVNPDTYS